MKSPVILLAFVFISLATVSSVLADGILVPGRWPPPGHRPGMESMPPPFAIKYHHVDVRIENQVARTRIDQVFVSEFNREMEATYIFPLPEGAAIQDFSLWIGNEKISGRLLDADEARHIYQSIVERRKDPALLEYIGRGLFMARVFPVPPHGEKRVELEYTELLTQKSNTVRYSYPLNTERFSAKPIASVTVAVDIASRSPIKSVYSPSHNVSVRHLSDHSVTVSYEESNSRPDTDLTVYYTLSEDEIGLGLLTFNPPGEDGYFILLASPRPQVQQDEIEAKDVIFVFDRTGSMSGEKIEQARDALKFCLNTLNEADRFNVLPFNESPDPIFDGLVPADKNHVEEALDLVSSLTASGGTNIDDALGAALPLLKRDERPSYIVFLTDGLPTVGVTDINRILANTERTAGDHVRLFVFGVGYDVNTMLLDKLAQQHKGATEYVRPAEDIEVKVSGLFRMISFPVLTDIALDFGDMKAYDILPSELPDLFKGSQITLAGRFRGKESSKITLSGKARGRTHRFHLAQSHDRSSAQNDFIPLIWAQRKIGFLLAEMRLHGRKQELIDEIVRLSKKHGIITEYTSFLVEEPMMVSSVDFGRHALMALKEKAEGAMDVDTGGWAVNQSVNIKKSRSASKVQGNTQSYFDAEGREVTLSNVRNVSNRSFFQQESNWVESAYTEDQPVLEIKSFSRAQFQLLERDPSLGELMALGEEVLILVNGRAVQVGPDGADELSSEQLEELFGS